MTIALSGVDLDNDENGEGRSVTDISIEDIRKVEAYDSPGAQGSSYKDRGRSAVKLYIRGTASGKAARTLLEGFWSCFKKGDPVEFRSDISGAADITKVLIENIVVTSAAGNRNRYDYTIGLWEYREPPEEPDTPFAGAGEDVEAEPTEEQKEAARKWIEDKASETDKKINKVTGLVLDDEGNPLKGAKVKIAGGGVEIEVTTDEEGMYEADNLDPATYTIKVIEEGYEDIEEEVTID